MWLYCNSIMKQWIEFLHKQKDIYMKVNMNELQLSLIDVGYQSCSICQWSISLLRYQISFSKLINNKCYNYCFSLLLVFCFDSFYLTIYNLLTFSCVVEDDATQLVVYYTISTVQYKLYYTILLVQYSTSYTTLYY